MSETVDSVRHARQHLSRSSFWGQ